MMTWWPQMMPAPMPLPTVDAVPAANNCFQLAADAAAAAAGACTTGGPAMMAAQQVVPGMWCVFVADMSATMNSAGYQGMTPFNAGCSQPMLMAPAPGDQATTSRDSGAAWGRNICLASHLDHFSSSSSSVVEANAAASFLSEESSQDTGGHPGPSTPRAVLVPADKEVEDPDIINTPPPKLRNAEEMIPTPSPVGLSSPGRYRLGRSSEACKDLPPFPAANAQASCCDDLPAFQGEASPEHNAQQRSVQVGRVHSSAWSWHDHWNQGHSAPSSQAKLCSSHSDKVHATAANSAFDNGSVTDSISQHAAHNNFHNTHNNSNTHNSNTHSNVRGRNRRQAGGTGRGVANNGNVARPQAQTNSSQQHAVHSVRSNGNPVSSDASKEPADPLSSALWHIMEQVLVRRPELEAGKKVVVPFSEWLQDLPELDQQSRLAGVCPTRATVNRALRQMSKRLPGCAWTVDLEKSEIQVHLADVGRFSAFCDGM
eukprot:TRINITY_DN5080_c0_g1_i1.p1 TRINITY_DN5080_c0_g1~~TRINITY_DN5080_c0_g1_i1.p1  ORF type:complete len:485 (+),score=91.40 TRINITY_DN5080_c0_g1_i1:185-1639(+)